MGWILGIPGRGTERDTQARSRPQLALQTPAAPVPTGPPGDRTAPACSDQLKPRARRRSQRNAWRMGARVRGHAVYCWRPTALKTMPAETSPEESPKAAESRSPHSRPP